MTLMEVLVATALGSVLLAGAVRLTATGWSTANRAMRRAHKLQALELVTQRWRGVAGSRPASGWEVTPVCFKAGKQAMEFSNGELCLRGPEPAQVRSLPLPRGATVRFSTEQPAEGPTLAVLLIEWTPRPQKTPLAVRIVAAPGMQERGFPGSSQQTQTP